MHRPLATGCLSQIPAHVSYLVAHDCGYPLSRYTCRATRVAADFLDVIAFCRCSTGVALHPLKILVSHLAPPPAVLGGVAPKFGSEKVSRYTGVSQLQLRVSRYTVQLRFPSYGHAAFSDLGVPKPNGPGRIKNTTTYSFTIAVLIHYLWRSFVNFPQENQVFQRPCRIVLLPSYFFLPPP